MTTTSYDGRIFTMDSFTSQTTDGSGQITVTLTHTPYADQAILVNLQGVSGAFAQFTSRSGANVTFTVYQKYDRTDTTSGGTVTGLPSGVSTDTTVGGPTFTSGPASATFSPSAGAQSGVRNDHTHNVTIDKISNHNHTNTATVLSTLNTTGGITLIVAYAF